MTCNLIVICRLRDERGEEERGNDLDGKMRGQSPRASPNGHSPVLNLSKSGNELNNSVDAPSDRSELHSPNPSIREDEEDNLSEGNVSEVDEPNDKDDDGGYSSMFFYLCFTSPHITLGSWLITINWFELKSLLTFLSLRSAPACVLPARFLISVCFFWPIHYKPIVI